MKPSWPEAICEPTFCEDSIGGVCRRFSLEHAGIALLGERLAGSDRHQRWELHHPAAQPDGYPELERAKALELVADEHVLDAPPILASFPGEPKMGYREDRALWLESAVLESLDYIRARTPGILGELAMSSPGSWDYDYAIDTVSGFREAFRTIERLVRELELIERQGRLRTETEYPD